MVKRTLWLVLAIIFINFVNAEFLSVDPCAGNVIFTEDGNNIYANSPCFDIQFPKNYGNEIIAFDKYNDKEFNLKAMQLYDKKTSNPNDYKTISFQDKPMIPSYSDNVVSYTMNDGVNNVILTYTINANMLKQGIEINDWVSNWVEGSLVLRTKYHKDSQASSHFVNLPAIVDDVEQPLIVSSVTDDQSTFYEQTLYTGKSFTSLIQDPLYFVDYSPAPANHLINGYVSTDDDSDFSNIIGITLGISDNLSTTRYEIIDYEVYGVLQNALYEDFEDGNADGWTEVCIGADCDGSGGFVTTTAINGTYSYLLRGISGGNDELMSLTRSVPTINYENISVQYQRYTSSIELGEWGSLEASYDGGSTWNVLENITSNSLLSTQTFNLNSSYSNNPNFQIRLRGLFDFTNDEFYFDDIKIKGVYKANKGQAINGRWSQVYDSNYDWFLFLNKYTTGTQEIFVRAYNNSNVISNQYISENLSGIGNFNINVSSLMQYQSINKSLSFTQFRVYSDSPVEISEMFLRKEANDTELPQIYNCSIYDSETHLPKTEFSCLESIHFDCIVTDNTDIDNVVFTINSINYSAEKEEDNHYFVSIDLTENTSLTQYQFIDVYAYDIVNNMNTSTPNLIANYTCIFEDYINIQHNSNSDVIGITNTTATIQWLTSNGADSLIEYGLSPDNLSLMKYYGALVTEHSVWLMNLIPNTTYYYNITSSTNPYQEVGTYNFTTFIEDCDPNWQQVIGICQINDSRLIYYEDNNNCGTTIGLPIDNGTYVSCNYCTEDIEESLTPCLWNGTGYFQNKSYVDNNYFLCCAITGLVSDCSILYSPFNVSISQMCSELQEDFDVQFDDNVLYGLDLLNKEKVYGKVYINGTSEYSCVSYVKTPYGKLIQSNPVYEKQTGALLTLTGKSYEDRSVFTTNNGLTNIYWTNENIIIDGRVYVFGVECSNGTDHKISERAINVLYENINSPITRWMWLKQDNNMTGLLFGLIGAFIILGIIGILLYQIWGRRRW